MSGRGTSRAPKRNKSKPLALFEVAKGMITGEQPDVADVRHVSEREMDARGG